MNDIKNLLGTYAGLLQNYYSDTEHTRQHPWYPMFHYQQNKIFDDKKWVHENKKKFLSDGNQVLNSRWFFSEMGAITAMEYTRQGSLLIVGFSTGMIQIRDGTSGHVVCTLRSIQFPPKPIYCLQISPTLENVCYASSMDGTVYKIILPNLKEEEESTPKLCIKVDPSLEYLNKQFYGGPGALTFVTPMITQRSPAMSMAVTSDENTLAVGYADSSIKLYDMETHEAITTYKIHKLRIPFVPKKLQRIHTAQVCAIRSHPERSRTFASASWDQTLRIWDVRCKVGCVMTFECTNVCSDSIDLNRDQLIAGSWQPTEALTVWDLVAKKRLNVITVQNRRPNVDGEYIYTCRFWRSNLYNRKGKYAIIGGSGTQCLEVINLHNRYIACSYPAKGSIVAATSYQERIAFGGTAPVLEIVNFHEPKHEKYEKTLDMNSDNYDTVVSLYDLTSN